MNRFRAMKLNMRLARLIPKMSGMVKMAPARMRHTKTVRFQKIHYILKCPVIEAARHSYARASSNRPVLNTGKDPTMRSYFFFSF